MKKIFIILVLLVYGAASMGATVHMHYCMNEFTGWNLWHDDEDSECGKCGMKERKDGCCKDEHKQIKVEDDHHKSRVAKHVQLLSAPALLIPFPNYIFKATSIPLFAPLSNAPPHIPQRLHLVNCVFLI
jgi:hypothetical protein